MNNTAPHCWVCQHQTTPLFKQRVLNTYDVTYFRCQSCGFVQTEQPYWLEQAYQTDAIAALDTGLVGRNILLAKATVNLLKRLSHTDDARYLDYGGGSGLFVRLMRDHGYDFYRHDPHSANIFARHFSLDDLSIEQQTFQLVTAFEVLEHVINPSETLNTLLTYADTVFISTELQPKNLKALQNWEYLVPECGQHIGFHTPASLNYLAQKFAVHYYSNGHNCHLFSKHPLPINPSQLNDYLQPPPNKTHFWQRHTPPTHRPSLTLPDFIKIKAKLGSVQ